VRLGYAFDRVFLFGTAGAAFGNEKAIVSAPGLGSITSAFPAQLGWTVGGGVEYAFTEAISAKGEYLFVQLGNSNCPQATVGCLPPAANGVATIHALYENLVRAGVNYRFSW
jgi:outer membrane immunogenic protein